MTDSNTPDSMSGYKNPNNIKLTGLILSGAWERASQCIITAGADPFNKYNDNFESHEESGRFGVSGDFSDIIAAMNKPPMGHWLAEKDPQKLKPWIQMLEQCGLQDPLKEHLNNCSSANPMQFGRYSVLHLVIREGRATGLSPQEHIDLCEFLMDKGSDPAIGDSKGRSCLLSLLGDTDQPERMLGIGNLLLKRGADPYQKLLDGKSFLEEKGFAHEEDLLHWGLDQGFNPDLGVFNGKPRYSLLHLLCSTGPIQALPSLKMMQKILEVCKDRINEPAVSGNTPLHVLANPSIHQISSSENKILHQGLIELLLSHGADWSIKNDDGLDPMEYARANGGTEVQDAIGMILSKKEKMEIEAFIDPLQKESVPSLRL